MGDESYLSMSSYDAGDDADHADAGCYKPQRSCGLSLQEVIAQLDSCFDAHDIAALIHIDPFAKEMFDSNPDKAIAMISQVYDDALNSAYSKDGKSLRGLVEAMAGGPFERIPWLMYNVVGAAYPHLERETKDKVLSAILSILDKRNYAEVNGAYGAGHTTGIREPLLLADIAITRGLYWPGLDEGSLIIKSFPSFYELSNQLIDRDGMFRHQGTAHMVGAQICGVNSDFVVAYALLRSDFSSWGEDYVKVANPNFLERVLMGVTAINFAGVKDDNAVKSEMEKHFVLLPESVHGRLEPLRQLHWWADVNKFP